MKRLIALVFMFSLLASGGLALAQGPTDTPSPSLTPSLTPSITPTLTNSERYGLSTIAPPPSCGTIYTPCGSLPWTLPRMPTMVLPSPTARPTDNSAYFSGSATPTPTAFTSAFDVSPINTLQSNINGQAGTLVAQATQIISVDGTPVNIVTTASDLGQNAGAFFAYLRALQLTNFGGTGGVITFCLILLAFTLLVQLANVILPILLAIVRLILEIITAAKPV